MDKITRQAVIRFFDEASAIMTEKKDYLIELDAALGDGDLGLTMSTGFGEAKRVVHESSEADLGKLFMQAGMAIAKIVPSTMGTLVGSGFMKAAKALKGKEELEPCDLAVFVTEFVTGLMERGKAKPGDRTIIDSLNPAAESLKSDTGKGVPLADAVRSAVNAAADGVEATKNMKAAFGRGVFFGEQVLGKPDQGAIVGMYIIKAWEQAVCD